MARSRIAEEDGSGDSIPVWGLLSMDSTLTDRALH